MDTIMRKAEHLKGTDVYWMLSKAAEMERTYLCGMLTDHELDAMTFLRPCAMLWKMESEKELALAFAEHIRDFCLDLDRHEAVDRSTWIILSTILYGDPFAIFEEYKVSVLKEDTKWKPFFQVWDYWDLEKHGLSPRLTDPGVYASAAAYIKKRGRARWVVQQWLLEDVDRFYGFRDKPFFPAKRVLSFIREGQAKFASGRGPAKPFRRGQRVTLKLIDDREMDFQPEVRILSDRKAAHGREARGWAWYRNCYWLMRICYNPEYPEKAIVDRYALYPFEFMGFHVLSFVILGGDYRRAEPLSVGDSIRVRLMDLWGQDLRLSGTITKAYDTSFDVKAEFPDGQERRITIYTSKRVSDYSGDIAVVERSAQYPLPKWTEKEL